MRRPTGHRAAEEIAHRPRDWETQNMKLLMPWKALWKMGFDVCFPIIEPEQPAFCHFPHETEETQAAWTFTNFIRRPVDRVAVWHSVRHLPDRSKVRLLSGFPVCPGGMAPNASNALSHLHQILNWGSLKSLPWKEKGWQGVGNGDTVMQSYQCHIYTSHRDSDLFFHRDTVADLVEPSAKEEKLHCFVPGSWHLRHQKARSHNKKNANYKERITWKSNFSSPGGLKLWPH